MDHLALRAAWLAALLLGLAAVPAAAGARGQGRGQGGGSGDGWRAVKLCQSESCWAKHPDGWRTVPRERHSRR